MYFDELINYDTFLWNEMLALFEFLEATGGDDFVGVQTYSRARVGPAGVLGPEPGARTTLMGYEFWPEALEATIRRAWGPGPEA